MRENYNLFFEKLNKRFQKHDIIKISEDCIRYDFFISLSSITDTSDIVLEYPNNNEKIDCVVKYPDSKLEAMEFKFFRPIPSGKNKPQTQLLGQLFKDFFKLENFKEVDIKTIILIADKNMERYINNKFQLFENINNSHLQININKKLFGNQEKTFQENIKPYNIVELNLERLFCKKIIKTDDEYIVAIFNIK
jgi:hypothetical protein